ncbi:class E sortase [Streptomyces sp. HB2AG]|nr:class E sortase [Streptomyces sp. HB2AG]MCZ2524692.1 class E sortase [Streptomyces sp. HB2AG]
MPVTPGGRAARRRAARAAQAAAPDAPDAPAVPGAPAAPGAPATDAGTQAPPVVPGGRAARRRAAQEAAGRHGRATGPRDGADGAAAPVVPAASAAFPAPSAPPAPGGAGSLPADAPTAVLPALADPVPSTDAARTVPALPGGGRAARRRARAAGTGASPGPSASAESPSPVPGGRAQARRAARAARGGPAVVASQVAGELFITLGVLMLLFVAYQLWWTNVLALQEAGGRADELQSQWKDKGDKDARDPGAFEPGQGFAIIYIPKLDVKAPIAEGIDKHKVLDKGLVGHYGEAPLETAMPWDEQGNFALAGHRNTHGEPFRYINRLEPGDEIIVETADRYYTYEMASILPQTPPSNVAVIDPVPEQGGFTQPGRYITLTTCTPEFTSTYRMIVWGKMVDERPRSKGKPDALVG